MSDNGDTRVNRLSKWLQGLTTDRVFRMARIWSNGELGRFAHLYNGSVANISGWRDQDKEGSVYKAYFRNCTEYYISNYSSSACGFQGDLENEFYLDLEEVLPDRLYRRFDTVFNHTTLEHVFEVRRAVANLCAMCSDSLILITPFLQQEHESYGDFWRFTPLALCRLLKTEGVTPIYMSWNDKPNCSIYVFTIASRKPECWSVIRNDPGNMLEKAGEAFIGTQAICNSWAYKVRRWYEDRQTRK